VADASHKRPATAAAADRKKQILKAAVEVFAERGFHRTRVSDIARRAGVAYGLIYHYFDSKDAVLNAVFETNWSVFLKVLRDLRDAEAPRHALEKLRSVADLLLDALEVAPAIMQVVIQEVSRSDRFVEVQKLDAFREGFELVRGMIADGQARGELRGDIDPMVAAHAFFGALETVCTGVMLEQLAAGPEQAERTKRTVHALLLDGLRPELAAPETRAS
jgi:AcrR family transcriptional regulator